VTVQAVGAIASATNALAQDVTQHQTLSREAQELRTWLGRAAGVTSILASDDSAPNAGPAAPSVPTAMQAVTPPGSPPSSTDGTLNLLM
jgi:hypothetical protein